MPHPPEVNNAIAESFFDAVWNEGDLSVLDTLIAPDAVDHSTVGSGKQLRFSGTTVVRTAVDGKIAEAR